MGKVSRLCVGLTSVNRRGLVFSMHNDPIVKQKGSL